MFTFDYVFAKQRSLIDMPAGFYGAKAVSTKAKVRNPLMLVGIDKSLWFSVCHLDDIHAWKRSTFEHNIEPGLTIDKLIKEEKILTQEQKLHQVELRSEHQAKKSKKVSRKRRSGGEEEENHSPSSKEKEVSNLTADLSSGLSTERIHHGSTLQSVLKRKIAQPVPAGGIPSTNLKSSLKRR
jgi:hypothetical protein